MRILKTLRPDSEFILQDIKEQEITVKQLEEMHELAGSYEALFSRRAKLYKEMGLKDMALSEKDFKHYLLKHYTFLQRPVIIYNSSIFIGNSKKTVEAANSEINA